MYSSFSNVQRYSLFLLFLYSSQSQRKRKSVAYATLSKQFVGNDSFENYTSYVNLKHKPFHWKGMATTMNRLVKLQKLSLVIKSFGIVGQLLGNRLYISATHL